MKNGKKLFLIDYLWIRRKSILLFTLFAFVFAIVFMLYGLPMAAIAYPALLCVAIALVTMGFDAYTLRKKLKRLALLSPELGEWSTPSDALEAEYQSLCRRVAREKQAEIDEQKRRFSELQAYYTLWAHQVKLPMASMHLRLQSEEGDLPRFLMHEVQRMENYVEMAMAYLKLEDGARDLLIRQCEIDDIITQCVKRTSAQFIGKHLSLHYEPLQKQILTDEKWLGIVIEQLVTNALQYTDNGGISIDWEEPCTLLIRDTGRGIAREDLPRIFEKGYTGCNGHAHHQSSGIGLYLCRRICDQLGHGIRLKSAPDEGTTVLLDFDQARRTE